MVVVVSLEGLGLNTTKDVSQRFGSVSFFDDVVWSRKGGESGGVSPQPPHPPSVPTQQAGVGAVVAEFGVGATMGAEVGVGAMWGATQLGVGAMPTQLRIGAVWGGRGVKLMLHDPSPSSISPSTTTPRRGGGEVGRRRELPQAVAERLREVVEEVPSPSSIGEGIGEVVEGCWIQGAASMEIGLGTHKRGVDLLQTGAPVVGD